MDPDPFDAAIRALSLGERTRRQTLWLLGSAGLGLGSMAAMVDANARKKRRRGKKKKKKFKGDKRCKGKGIISKDGICLPLDEREKTLCVSDACFCALDSEGARACVSNVDPQICNTTCEADDDCDPGSVCISMEGCCLGNPDVVRTCAQECPVG